jgi:hypothetical protein
VNPADRALLQRLIAGEAHAITSESAAELSALGHAAALIFGDEQLVRLAAPYEQGDVSRLLRLAAGEDDDVDAQVEANPAVLLDLYRADVAWSHPSFEQCLEDSALRSAAAWMLASSDDPFIEEWLASDHDAAAVVDVAVAAARAGGPELFEALAPWFAPIEAAEPTLAPRLEAALFVCAPRAWARDFLDGDLSGAFLFDDVAMADVISYANANPWLTFLGAAEPGSAEFGALASLCAAFVGALVELETAGDDAVSRLLDAVDHDDWDRVARLPTMSFLGLLAEESSEDQMRRYVVHEVIAYLDGEPSDAEPPTDETFRPPADEPPPATPSGLGLADLVRTEHCVAELNASALIDAWLTGPPLRAGWAQGRLAEVLDRLAEPR